MRSKVIGWVLAVFVGVSSCGYFAHEARGLDLSSTTVALGGAGMAVVGIVMMDSEDPEAKATGKMMLIGGLVMSAVFCSSSIALNALAISTMDQVEDLDMEMAAGGGPVIDALSAGFGMPKSDVMDAVRMARTELARDPADIQAFSTRLIQEIAKRFEISDELLARRLYALHAERHLIAAGRAVRHQGLSELTGVPLNHLAPIIAEVLDEHLDAHAEEGRIVSARAIFHRNPRAVLDRLADRLEAEHGDIMGSRARQHIAEFEARLQAIGT